MDHEWVQISLARVHAKVDVLKLLNWKVAWASDKGLNPADASATKVYGTELALEVYRLLLEVVGQAGYLVEGSPGAVLRGRLEHQARSQTIFTFGGGTNEIQRDIVAMIGLGHAPRPPVTFLKTISNMVDSCRRPVPGTLDEPTARVAGAVLQVQRDIVAMRLGGSPAPPGDVSENYKQHGG